MFGVVGQPDACTTKTCCWMHAVFLHCLQISMYLAGKKVVPLWGGGAWCASPRFHLCVQAHIEWVGWQRSPNAARGRAGCDHGLPPPLHVSPGLFIRH